MESMEGCRESPTNTTEQKRTGGNKKILVDFTEFGGHSEWINVECNQLVGFLGHFMLGSTEEVISQPKTSATPKNAAAAANKKVGHDTNGQAPRKICTLSALGACRLANLGNTTSGFCKL